MSVEAITWALKTSVSHSSAKFVLVVLANCAHAETFEAYPSVAYIARSTEQDRKTIIANLKRLIEAGYIEDTGKRAGSTSQIVVYRLISNAHVNYSSEEERHYVYRLTNEVTGQFYIGVRSCIGEPEQDSYMGSGRWPAACKEKGIRLVKEILSEYGSRASSVRGEQELIDKYLADPLCMNSPKTGTVNNDTKTGTVKTVPKFHTNDTEIPAKEYQNSQETVPKTDHVNVSKRNKETKGKRRTQRNSDFDPVEFLLALDVKRHVIDDWMAQRELKKAEVTQTVIEVIQAEAVKLSWTLEAALREACARGWAGFKANWILREQQEMAAKGAAPAAVRRDCPWYLSATRIEEMGAEKGITMQPGEVFPTYKHRVFKAYDITDDMVRKAMIDFPPARQA